MQVLPFEIAKISLSHLTHWGRDKLPIFSNAFSWMKKYGFRLRFRWSLVLRFESTLFLDAAKPLSEPMVLSLLTHICVTQLQWFNAQPNPLFFFFPTLKRYIDWNFGHMKIFPFQRAIYVVIDNLNSVYRYIACMPNTSHELYVQSSCLLVFYCGELAPIIFKFTSHAPRYIFPRRQ